MKPRAEKAITTDRMVRICQMRAKPASIDTGTSVSSMASAMRSFFSHWPRTGSLSRKATKAATATGRPTGVSSNRLNGS